MWRPRAGVGAIVAYWCGLALCMSGGTYANLGEALPDLSPAEKLSIYCWWLHLKLWRLPHYRSGHFQNDLIKNLRNVALPGTGLPLSVICWFWPVALLFVWFGIPLAAFGAAVIQWRRGGTTLADAFGAALLTDYPWFTFWRLNCAVASYHALNTSDPGYALEDKMVFLEACAREGVPASPYLRAPKLVVKHRNEEGGLSLHTYKNAAYGGEWIIQNALTNAAPIARLLPKAAPLSTFRLVTASRGCLLTDANGTTDQDVQVLSACFRAGREGAATDHSCIIFDVDLTRGVIGKGTSNAHWYQLGLTRAWRSPWVTEGHTIEAHPDTGTAIAAERVPDFDRMVQLVRRAHRKLLPGVPLIGWDVALTEEAGMCLLEANLSCNFFRASFEQAAYFSFVEDVLAHLEN